MRIPWFLALPLLWAACLPPARGAPTILKLEPYRKGVAARVLVAGKERLFTFDTAAGISIVSPTLADEIGCEAFGRLSGHVMTGDRLDLPRCDGVAMAWDGMALTIPHAGVFKVETLLAKDAMPVDGTLGLDIFAGRTVTLDLAGGRLTVETPESAAERVRGATQVPAHLLREVGGRALAVTVDVPTLQGALAMELDTGNGGTILVSKPFATVLGLDPDAAGPQRGSFTVAPGVEAKGLIFTPDLLIDGNLGMPFLKDWIVTLDLKDGRVWMRRNPVSPPPGMGDPPVVQ
ncbi:MAG: hypothetical protein ABW184_03975 [Sphingobium sp.]